MVRWTEEGMLRQQTKKTFENNRKHLERSQIEERRGPGRPKLDVNRLQCKYCYHISETPKRLQKHILRHHNAVCQEPGCGFISLKMNNLKDHNNIEHQGKFSILKFQCSTCSYATNQRFNLQRHEGKCSGKKAEMIMSM